MYWFILLVFLITLIVLSYLLASHKVVTPEKPNVVEKEQAANAVIPNPSEEMLKTFYMPAKEKVDLDFPPKKIGCCPFSKPASTDLPIGNIPMCYASVSQSHLKQI